jgi:hypothetical protein
MAAQSLAEAYPIEQARCRELLKWYQELPNRAGAFGAFMIEAVLLRADDAAAAGDIVAMIRSFAELQAVE